MVWAALLPLAGTQAAVSAPQIPVASSPHPGSMLAIAPGRAEKRVRFHDQPVSMAVRPIAEWVVDSGDNHRHVFMIIDKVEAKAYLFDAQGSLQQTAPVLLGLAKGDKDASGVGALPLSGITPQLRNTPAGRFEARLGRNLKGQEILWLDYAAGLSLHRVVTGSKTEHRQQRLDSPSPADNRISFGCVNVPVQFFEQGVLPAFKNRSGVVYVLPETRPASELFNTYRIDAE